MTAAVTAVKDDDKIIKVNLLPSFDPVDNKY